MGINRLRKVGGETWSAAPEANYTRPTRPFGRVAIPATPDNTQRAQRRDGKQVQLSVRVRRPPRRAGLGGTSSGDRRQRRRRGHMMMEIGGVRPSWWRRRSAPGYTFGNRP